MEQHTLLIEYLKEQYAQARQHETLRTNATTFLTSAAGLIIGLKLKDAAPGNDYHLGGIVFLIGLASYHLNESHFRGNRFHTRVAKYTRIEIEKLATWTVSKPSEIRVKAATEVGLSFENGNSVGASVHLSIQRIPKGIMLVGLLLMLYDLAGRYLLRV